MPSTVRVFDTEFPLSGAINVVLAASFNAEAALVWLERKLKSGGFVGKVYKAYADVLSIDWVRQVIGSELDRPLVLIEVDIDYTNDEVRRWFSSNGATVALYMGTGQARSAAAAYLLPAMKLFTRSDDKLSLLHQIYDYEQSQGGAILADLKWVQIADRMLRALVWEQVRPATLQEVIRVSWVETLSRKAQRQIANQLDLFHGLMDGTRSEAEFMRQNTRKCRADRASYQAVMDALQLGVISTTVGGEPTVPVYFVRDPRDVDGLILGAYAAHFGRTVIAVVIDEECWVITSNPNVKLDEWFDLPEYKPGIIKFPVSTTQPPRRRVMDVFDLKR